jgi:hypothetical protein
MGVRRKFVWTAMVLASLALSYGFYRTQRMTTFGEE